MTKRTQKSSRMRVAALAIATAASLAVIVPTIAIAGDDLQYKSSTTAVPNNGETTTNRDVPQNGEMSMHHEMSTTDTAKLNTDMRMQGMTNTGNVDHDFASNMRRHHQMGVNMAQAQIKDGQDPEMTRFARDFVAAQQAEIVTLDRWLASQNAATTDIE